KWSSYISPRLGCITRHGQQPKIGAAHVSTEYGVDHTVIEGPVTSSLIEVILQYELFRATAVRRLTIEVFMTAAGGSEGDLLAIGRPDGVTIDSSRSQTRIGAVREIVNPDVSRPYRTAFPAIKSQAHAIGRDRHTRIGAGFSDTVACRFAASIEPIQAT